MEKRKRERTVSGSGRVHRSLGLVSKDRAEERETKKMICTVCTICHDFLQGGSSSSSSSTSSSFSSNN